MIPWLIAGAVGALVASEVMDDNKKELQTSKSREQVSASEVPEEIRRQIEGGSSRNYYPSDSDSAETFYQKAQNYYYGLNGYSRNLTIAESFYKRAASAGHYEAKQKLRELF